MIFDDDFDPGKASQALGKDLAEVHGFVPMRHELLVLVKSWMTQMIEDAFFAFCWPGTYRSGTDCLRDEVAAQRINSIEALVGEAAVERAISEAYEEFGKGDRGEAGRIYLHGTSEEVDDFHREAERVQAKLATTRRDEFYADLLNFLAGRPHTIKQGTLGGSWADAARAAVAADPKLTLPGKKENC